MESVTAVILAGGAGSRFWPLSTNKLLFPFLGKRLIDFSVVDSLPSQVTNVVVIASPTNKDTLAALKFSKPTSVVVQPEPKGMANAILAAADALRNTSLLVMIADDVVDPALYSGLLKLANSSGADAMLTGMKTKHYRPLGYLVIEGDQIVDIKEKPGAGKEPSEYVTITGHFIKDSNAFITELQLTRSDRDDVYEKAFASYMRTKRVEVFKYDGMWASTKMPWHILDVMENLLTTRVTEYRGSGIEMKSNVIIEGPVYIGDNVKIFENTKIVGPAFIGDNTIIGNNNIIRHAYIGRDCVTGFSTDITRSYVGDGCWFHSNYIGDSVLEGNISMGSGAVLANLRLDDGDISSVVKGEKVSSQRSKLGAVIGIGVRIGVNASIMPGVKIGKNSFIGSGVILDKDVEDDSFVTANPSYQVTKNRAASSSTTERTEFRKKI